MRRLIVLKLGHGFYKPQRSTARKWDDVFWGKVFDFIAKADTRELNYITNVCRELFHNETIEKAFYLLVENRAKQLPSPAQELKQAGIVIVGVTD